MRNQLHHMWVEYFRLGLEKVPGWADAQIADAAKFADAACAAQSRREADEGTDGDNEAADGLRALVVRTVSSFGRGVGNYDRTCSRSEIRERLLAFVTERLDGTIDRCVQARDIERAHESDVERFEEAIPF